MVDQGKDADLRAGDPRTGAVPDRFPLAEPPLSDQTRPADRGGLSDHTRNRLAAQLRAMYDTVAQQPIPDRFAELIAKLDSSDRE